MTRLAYFDQIGGLAGDMILAALLDAGAPRSALDAVPTALGMPDIRIETERVLRNGIESTLLRIIETASADRPSRRPAAELMTIVTDSDLAARVKTRALDALGRIATVEAGIHGTAAEDVMLHELGGIDTLIDVCGAFALLDAAGIERVICSPVPYARGTVPGTHGAMPAPAPSTLELLRGAPLVGVKASAELVTPTGAAIAAVAADGWGELPPLTLDRVGYGAGHRDLPERPNVLRIVIGTVVAGAPRDVVLLEANLDDLLPELVPDAIERCTAAGALDVWTVPAQMKKGRPGFVIAALARADAEAAVAAALLEHTSTLGVRVTSMRRYELERETREVLVEGRTIRLKIGVLAGRVVNVAPEHDDCAAVAALTGRPVKQIWAEALAVAHASLEPAGI